MKRKAKKKEIIESSTEDESASVTSEERKAPIIEVKPMQGKKKL